ADSGLVDGVDLNDLLLNAWDVRLDVLVEPAVVLLLALPDLGDSERAIVHEGDVVHEPRLGLQLLDQRRCDLVVLRRGHSRGTVPDEYGHGCSFCCWDTDDTLDTDVRSPRQPEKPADSWDKQDATPGSPLLQEPVR